MIQPGSRVRLLTPDNPRLHGATAQVVQIEEWGAHVLTSAAGSGRFRAFWHEMEPLGENGHAKAQGYTGDVCDQCGGSSMKRNGSCLVCADCGSTSGCS